MREPGHLVPEGGTALDVETRRRLVEEDDARAVDEREREIKPALHAARIASDLAIGGVGETDPVEELLAARATLGLRDPLERRLQPQMVASCQERIECRLLQRSADRSAHLRSFVHDVVPCDPRRTRCRRQQRGQHQHRRRLPGTIRAEKAVDLTRVDVQIDAVHCSQRLEVPDELLDPDAVVGHHSATLAEES